MTIGQKWTVTDLARKLGVAERHRGYAALVPEVRRLKGALAPLVSAKPNGREDDRVNDLIIETRMLLGPAMVAGG